ncbi:MAG: hypothetical protein LBN38_05415 [Verrucomicrobiota bacterium]|jgi:tetratricopeptide (TPR) repeat protein|nr:hypothetical protein [Verrucomicrobiota bacterium]
MMYSRHPLAWFLLTLSLGVLSAAAQLGPYPIATKQARFDGTLGKRDKDMLWITRAGSDGRGGPQIGVPVADIVQIQVPKPTVFSAAERLQAAPRATDAQFKAVHDALDQLIRTLRSFRDLPGIPVNEALLWKGRLYQKKGLWREAVRQYEDILMNTPSSPLATQAQILAGVAYEKMGEHQFAVEYLGDVELPEEDEELLSAMLYSMGNSYAALENHDNALMAYLSLVVFYPYLYDNEARGLAAALDCYAALEEWEPLYRTIQTIQATYPDTAAAKRAGEIASEYQTQLGRAGHFVDGPKVVPDAEQTAVSGTTVDYSKPVGSN